MLLASLFQRLTATRSRRRGSGPALSRRSVLPRLQVLEDRSLPSTYPVTNLLDGPAGSLRAAILSGDDTIVFAPGLHGTITLGSELPINHSVTINGPGAVRLSVSGNGAGRVFDISGSANVNISGLTITDGLATAGGGILLDGSAALSISHCTLSGNEAKGSLAGSVTVPDGDGGGIEDNSSAALTVTSCTFDSNMAVARGPNAPLVPGYILALGGAIDLSAYSTGTATISDSTFTGNHALGGVAGASAGGGALSDSSITIGATANMTVQGCTLNGNSAIGVAGGVGTAASPNFGSGQGGAINNFANLVVRDSTITGNWAQGTPLAPGVAPSQSSNSGSSVAGGGIFELSNFLPNGTLLPASMTVADCTLAGNQAVGGAGSAGDAANPPSAGSVGEGGGISVVVFSSAQVSGCTLVDNVAQGGAGGGHGAVGGDGVSGGIDIAVDSSVMVSNTTLIGNQAIGGAAGAGAAGGAGVGGGIDVGSGALVGFNPDNCSLTLTGGIFLGNQAIGGAGGAGSNGGDAWGGGLSVLTGSTAGISTSALTLNVAQGGAAGTGGTGGDGLGAGAYNGTAATLTLTTDLVTLNDANGSPGIGGGVYTIGTFTDSLTLIVFNHASTSHNDIGP